MPPHFAPLRNPPSRARVAVLLAGPLLWLVSLVVVAFVIEKTNAVAIGLLIAAGSVAVSIPLMLLSRRLRVRADGKASRADAG